MQMEKVVDKVKANFFAHENEIKEQTELKSKNIADIMNEGRKMSETGRTDSRFARTRNLVPKVRFPKPGKSALGTRLEKTIIFVTFMKRNKKTLNVTGKIGADYRPTKALRLERGQGIFARNISAEILQTNPVILGHCEELLNARKPNPFKSPYLNYLVKAKFDVLDQVLVTQQD